MRDAELGVPGRPMSKILEGLGPFSATLFIGDQEAASDLDLLEKNNIAVILNCALNLDIDYVQQRSEWHPGGENLEFGFAPVRVAKVGLIDGPGNNPSLLVAACYALDGLLQQKCPDQKNYPANKTGNMLLHCRGGRSRSVTVCALYLHRKMPERWPTFAGAVDYVREKRGMKPSENQHMPTSAMLELANVVLNTQPGNGVSLAY